MLRLLLDANVSPRVAEEVRRQRPAAGIRAIREWQGGMYLNAPDGDLLEAAASHGLTLVTFDIGTITELLSDWYAVGRSYAGVVLINRKTLRQGDIGGQVRALVELIDGQDDRDWRDRAVYLDPGAE